MLSPRAPEGWGGRSRPPKMPAMRGLLAPQNTFLDTIATRFDGTRESDPRLSQTSRSLPTGPAPHISAFRPLALTFPPSPRSPLLAGTTVSFQKPFHTKVQSQHCPRPGETARSLRVWGLGCRLFAGARTPTHPIPESGAISPTTLDWADWGMRRGRGAQEPP